jgi:hypothetical protein
LGSGSSPNHWLSIVGQHLERSPQLAHHAAPLEGEFLDIATPEGEAVECLKRRSWCEAGAGVRGVWCGVKGER